MFFKEIYNLGVRLRNPSIFKINKFLQNSEKWSTEKLETYQFEKLKELLIHTERHSAFYQNKWKELEIEISEIKSLTDIEKLPITEKRDLLDFNKEIQSSHQFKDVKKATTSGSSGESLAFYREEYADSFNRASIFRGYRWHGVQPWELNGYFWGFNFSKSAQIKTQILDFLQHRFRVFSYEKSAFESFVNKLDKAKYIHGYSSMIYQTAKLINERKLPKPKKLKMVKGTSEKIYDKYHDEVKQAFGLPIISEYGATESGIIAFECKEGKMHINMEGVLVEEIDHEILVTNLQMKAFPIIRYKLGDYIKLAPKEEKCNCGLAHRVLNEVTGRIGESVYGLEQVYPSLYFYYIFKNLVKEYQIKLNYQVIQNTKGYLIFKIEQILTNDEVTLLEKEITKYFKGDIKFEIQQKSTLEVKGKKMKSFISNI